MSSASASTYDDVIVEIDLKTGKVRVNVPAELYFFHRLSWVNTSSQVLQYMNTSTSATPGLTAEAIACG